MNDGGGLLRKVPISALEHYVYCPRQCALIHVDKVWGENLFTLRGAIAHERVVDGDDTIEDGVSVVRSLRLHSDRLGLIGVADVVEMRPEGPFPIEYKSGKGRTHSGEIQLCAQAMCLEEMLGVEVPAGAVYRAGSRRRHLVDLTAELRCETEEVITAVRTLLECSTLPGAPNDSRCSTCSLIDTCLPDVVANDAYVAAMQADLFTVKDGEDADA